jgi:hypothetical protein
MFIIDVNASSLSMEGSEFQKHMESARLATQVSVASPSSSQGPPTSARANQEEIDMAGLLTILVNLFEEVCLTMGLHSSFLSQNNSFLPSNKCGFFCSKKNIMWFLL